MQVGALSPKKKMLEGTSASSVLVGITLEYRNKDEQSNAAESKVKLLRCIL